MNKGNILIADDSRIFREFLIGYIKKHFPEYKTKEFKTGEELNLGLENLTSLDKLIITDERMPGMKGSEIIKKWLPRIKVPMILYANSLPSALADEIHKKKIGWLDKPFTEEDFLEIMNKYLP